jgi:hypothetical protein
LGGIRIMITWVETFHGESLSALEREINSYAEEYKAEIVSTSIAVREYKYSTDTFYALVVFKGIKRGW